VIGVTDLRVEFTVNPLGLDEPRPRFSWVPVSSVRGSVQRAYRIIVGSFDSVSRGVGDLWDSGVVESSDNVAEYRGPPLRSFTRYYWRVRWWDGEGRDSGWSSIAWFETGVMDPGEWRGSWIGGGQLLRREFEIAGDVAEARAYVSGLGYYELRINGSRVGDRALDPPWSEYTKTVYYSVYDVTGLVKRGANAVGIVLGRGRYGQRFRGVKYYGEPRAIVMLRVKLSDGRLVEVVSDESWRCLEKGPILSDDIYNGYKYDAGLEPRGWDSPGFNDSSWHPCSRVEPPGGRLRSTATIPATKAIAVLKPREHLSPAPGVHVFDFGQNITGWVRVRVRGGAAGAEIRVRHSETLNPDGSLNTLNLRDAEATDIYILRGDEVEVLEPRFTYHGFRYAEITGYPGTPSMDDVEAVVVHADLEPIGSFTSSDRMLNSIHRITIWSLKGNLMNGVQTDCPQRDERMGWLGDAWLSSEAAALNFNMVRFYEKFVGDMIDAQREDGSIPDLVPPYWENYPADPAWGTAIIYIPWVLYKYYGDRRALEAGYEAMKRWWNYLYSMAKGGILYFNKYGDWVPPGRVRSVEHCPPEIISTWILYRDAKLLSEIASVLGRPGDSEYFEKRAGEILEAFNRSFLTERGYYSTYTAQDGSKVQLGGSQTCNALPLAFDMVPGEAVDRVLSSLVRSVEVEWDKHLNVGIIGAKYVPDVLARYGYAELAYEAITQDSYPGYGYMIREGATTLWERWEKLSGRGMNSHNHHMLGSVDHWIYKYAAGLEALEPGFKRVLVKPLLYRRLGHASASIYTVRGLLSVEWESRGSVFRLKARIPVGSTAEIHLPKIGGVVEVAEGGVTLWRGGPASRVPGILSAREEAGWVVVEVGSGSYSFEVRAVGQG